uniref:EOG090X0G12 n=1 Tax=Daphnia similis TaxID=35528 RepID=A0A4Y7LPC0_9CRUS|nr:EOG090X0G12 [Daphnia similis]SVE71378.1 EOG090X0G12 [Daphnia similis]SVE72010.1 EOG090X0G12 [Daphnia similis]SVE72637.1 EOG090X0G12 [Daphnia similis]
MAKVHVQNVVVLDNPSNFSNPFQFEITFECLEDLQEDLEWKIIYVGSAESETYDQVLDTVYVGPVPEGRHMFVFQAEPPQPSKIPVADAVGVTVVLLTCSYRGQEFIRVGYYVNNEYGDAELKENPPAVPQFDKLMRNILATNPRVTRFKVDWDDTNKSGTTKGHMSTLGRKKFDEITTIITKMDFDVLQGTTLRNFIFIKYANMNLKSYDLKYIIKNKKSFEEQILQGFDSVEELIDKLGILIKDHHKTNLLCCNTEKLSVATNYSKVLAEIDAIGWEKLSSVNHDFTELKLKMYDSLHHQHILNVKFNNNVPEFSTEYPRKVNIEWQEDINTLSELYSLFCQEAEQYQDFWKAMEELDAGCWVLEPENPSRRDTYRKISVAPNVSLKIEIDPNHPYVFPSITWLGSETAVSKFREKILDRIEVWDNDLPINTNLERLLEISLPLKQTLEMGTENYEVTCCICYSERLNGEVPSRTCDNSNCGQSFHIFCLYEWLRCLIQTTRKQGNKVFGECPYCEQPISCNPPAS